MQNSTQQHIFNIIENLNLSSNENSVNGKALAELARKDNILDTWATLCLLICIAGTIGFFIGTLVVDLFPKKIWFSLIPPLGVFMYYPLRSGAYNKKMEALKTNDSNIIFDKFSNYKILTDLFKCLQEFPEVRKSTPLKQGFHTAYELIQKKDKEKFAEHIGFYTRLFLSKYKQENIEQKSEAILKQFGLELTDPEDASIHSAVSPEQLDITKENMDLDLNEDIVNLEQQSNIENTILEKLAEENISPTVASTHRNHLSYAK